MLDNKKSKILNRIAKSLFAKCKKKQYWGKGGAGMMFICSEDDTVLLLLRASWVDQPNTWGIAGGGLGGEDWNDTPIDDPITNDTIFLRTARKEVKEECGSLPPKFNNAQIIKKTEYEDCGFRYITFIADITLDQKEKWNLVSNDGETDQFLWAKKSTLKKGSRPGGKSLHFGVKYTLSQTTI
jgi:hypothetical protein